MLSESSGKVMKIKKHKLTYFGPISAKKGLKISPTGTIFHTTWKYPHYACKPFGGNGQYLHNSHLNLLFVINESLRKLEAKYQNSTYTMLWAILWCTFYPNIGKIGCKLREPIRFEKRLTTDRWTDGQTEGRQLARHQIMSADYVSSGAIND